MDVPVGGVRDACLGQDRISHARIELSLEVAGYSSTKERHRITENDRSGFNRPNHRAGGRLFRIDQHRRDRVGELAALAAGLDVTPACRRLHGRHAYGLEDLAGPQRGFKCSGDELLDGKITGPATLRSVTLAPSAERADTQSAAGSA